MTAPTQRRAYADADDMTLVRRAQAGDAHAFGTLYDRHNAAVYQYLWIRSGNPTIAQDLAGDVWEKALRNITGCRYGSPIAWLMTIARNRAIDHYRSGRYRMEVIDEDIATAGERSPLAGVDDAVVHADENARLLQLVKRLPAPQQEAIALTYFLGLNSIEAAAVMDKTPEAVKALTLRGRRTLLRWLPAEAIGTPS